MSEPVSSEAKKPFGVWSGTGLVVADMIGAGVFLSTGFMAQQMPPRTILLAWLVGLVLAMAGARAYAEVARLVPRAGGEYRYLADLWHPFAGYLAGWASLLLGFSAPIAVDAIAAGDYAARVWPGLPPTAIACALIIGLTLAHALQLRTSLVAQNVLVAVKLALIVGFIAIGVIVGTTAWPQWVPPQPTETPVSSFAESMFFIAFAFSGWNAATYVADEFRSPTKDVPRAMLLGCALVGALYLALNYVFVANLVPSQLSAVFQYDTQQVTLGHAVMQHLLGEGAARVFSAVMMLLFISAMSAMMLVGPRVYTAMAADGVVPAAFKATHGKPPLLAVVLQGAVALVLVFTQNLKQVLSSLGALLTFFAALTCVGLFLALRRGPSKVALACAALYAGAAGWLLWLGFRADLDESVKALRAGDVAALPGRLWWLGGLLVATGIAYFVARRWRRAETT